MDFLAECTSPRSVLRALDDDLPTKMDQVHERLFQRLQNLPRGELGTRIRSMIAVVASARRPLHLEALEHAISVEANDKDIDSMSVPDGRHLISRAFGLVVIDEKTEEVRLYNETAAHYVQHRAVGMPNGDTLLAEATLAYLQLIPICKQPKTTQDEYAHLEWKKKEYPFLHYASSFWASHARASPENHLRAVLTLLKNSDARRTLTHLMWQDDLGILADWDVLHVVDSLHLAAYFGHLGAVNRILTNRDDVEVDVLDSKHTTPLMYAAMKGHKNVVEVLLSTGADSSRIRLRGRTALHRACQYTRIETVRSLLRSSKDVNLNAVDRPFRRTALSWAIHHKSKPLLQLLVREGYVGDSKIVTDHNRNNPLVLAAATGRIDLIQTLLEDGRLAIDSTSDMGQSALTVAAQHGHVPLIVLLLKKGANLEARDDKGSTVLLSSMPLALNHIVELFVKHGANIKALNNGGRGVLFKCAFFNRPKLLRFFLERSEGPDPNVQGIHGATPLYSAVEAGNLKCVEILLEFGARTDIRAKSRLTPLSMARERNRPMILALLLEARLKEQAKQRCDQGTVTQVRRASTQTFDDETPIHAAVVQMDPTQFTAYLDERAKKSLDINTLDIAFRQTALHIAVRENQTANARILLDKGARFDVADHAGFHALHVAVESRSLEMVRELIHRGADVNRGPKRALQVAIDRRFPQIACFFVNNGAVIDKRACGVAWIVGAAAQLGGFDVV